MQLSIIKTKNGKYRALINGSRTYDFNTYEQAIQWANNVIAMNPSAILE